MTLTVEKAKDNIRLHEKRLEFAANNVRESELTLQKLRKEFSVGVSKVKTARKGFEAGLAAYKRKSIVDAVFGFVQVIGQIMTATAGLADATKAGKADPKDLAVVADKIEAITDIISSVGDLTLLIADVADLTTTIAAISTMSGDMVQLAEQAKPPPNPAVATATAEAAARMRVKIVVWDNMKNMANTQLAVAPVTSIGGSQDYHKALSDMANWGKALYQQTLNHADLISKFVTEAMATKVAKSNAALTMGLLNSAKTSKVIPNNLLNQVSSETVDAQLSASRVVSDFCRSYFFFNFKECSPTLRLHLSDSLLQTNVKLGKAATSPLEAAGAFGSRTPIPFNGHHVLVDKVFQRMCYLHVLIVLINDCELLSIYLCVLTGIQLKY